MPQRQRFSGFGSVGGAMSDEIAQIMLEQETRKQQEFLNSLKLREADQADRRMQLNADLQRQQMEALAEQRAAIAAERKSRTAENLASTLTPGAALDETGAAALRDGGMGSLIDQKDPSAQIDVATGLGAATEGNPLGLSSGGARVVEGRSLFKGTAKQNKEAADRASRLAWVKAQPDSPMKRMLEAQLMTGDSSLPIGAFEDPNQPIMVVDPEDGTVKQVGSAPKGARVVTAPRDPKPDKPAAPQIFYDADGKPRAIRFGADGTAQEVPLPTGIASKNAPKVNKTPAEIEAEAAARAAGTVKGKKEAGGNEGGVLSKVLSAVGGAFGGNQAAPAAVPAPAGGVEEWVRDASGKLVRKQ